MNGMRHFRVLVGLLVGLFLATALFVIVVSSQLALGPVAPQLANPNVTQEIGRAHV